MRQSEVENKLKELEDRIKRLESPIDGPFRLDLNKETPNEEPKVEKIEKVKKKDETPQTKPDTEQSFERTEKLADGSLKGANQDKTEETKVQEKKEKE